VRPDGVTVFDPVISCEKDLVMVTLVSLALCVSELVALPVISLVSDSVAVSSSENVCEVDGLPDKLAVCDKEGVVVRGMVRLPFESEGVGETVALGDTDGVVETLEESVRVVEGVTLFDIVISFENDCVVDIVSVLV